MLCMIAAAAPGWPSTRLVLGGLGIAAEKDHRHRQAEEQAERDQQPQQTGEETDDHEDREHP
jgi:hypothetical protein